MKSLIATVLLLTLSAAAHAGPLADHMRDMSYILTSAKEKSASTENYGEASDLMRAMRGHAIAATALTPSAVGNLEEKVRNQEMIAYHQTMARLIYMTAAIENALANEDYEFESYSRAHDIENLFLELDKLMSYAHDRFR